MDGSSNSDIQRYGQGSDKTTSRQMVLDYSPRIRSLRCDIVAHNPMAGDVGLGQKNGNGIRGQTSCSEARGVPRQRGERLVETGIRERHFLSAITVNTRNPAFSSANSILWPTPRTSANFSWSPCAIKTAAACVVAASLPLLPTTSDRRQSA